MKLFKDFRRNRAGNVAITFALSIVPLILAVGAGVDMVRVNQAQTLLQAAADAAALGGGASSDTSEEKLQQIANSYLDANRAERSFSEVTVRKIKENKGLGVFSVEVNGSMQTSFMALAGVGTIDIQAIAAVKRGTSGPLEMVLALDTTFSMSESDKIGSLKTAATDLVNAIMTSDNVEVAVVPFADYFKVGTKYKHEPWVNVPADSKSEYESCESVAYPERTGCTMQTTCYSDGVPYSCSYENCTDWGTPVKTNCTMIKTTDTWDGCIGARPPAYHDSISDVSVPYPGVLWDCGAPLVTLTNNKADVLSGIDQLYPTGQTFIPSGLTWAWNVLTPESPLNEAKPMAAVTAKGGKKVLVLMTDGANTVAPYLDGNYGSPYDAGYGADSSYADSLTASLCSKIKAEGTIVYTVLFDVTDTTVENLLRACASDTEKSYVADDAAELLIAFKDIGASLTKLRLTR